MDEQILILPVEAPKCAKCGGVLPKGRKKWCYNCKPLKGKCAGKYHPAPDPEAYTVADRVAQARACGLSYGQYMGKLHAHDPMPKQLHRVRWPRGSSHRGE